jgi:D-threo-aldose 1-dehydrogenase
MADAALTRYVQGTSQLGGLFKAVDDETAWAALQTAWDLGVRHFDTAPYYGYGLSERRVGAFLSQFPRDAYTISTKTGRLLQPTDHEGDDYWFAGADPNKPVYDFSWDGVRRSLEQSLERLGLDRVDTLYIHDPDDFMDQAIGEAYPSLRELRDQGALAKIGAGMSNLAGLERFVAETDPDQIMLAGHYNLMARAAGERLLPSCAARGISVVAAGAYASGLLANPRPGAHYDWREATTAEIDTAVRLREHFAQFGVPLAAAAAQFPLLHPAVTAVTLGTRNAEQARTNVQFVTWDIPAEAWEAVL